MPKQQTLEEAKQLMEGLQSLRSKKMQKLLAACRKIKVKRLFWQLAEELQLPVLKKIDMGEIDFGSNSGRKESGAEEPQWIAENRESGQV